MTIFSPFTYVEATHFNVMFDSQLGVNYKPHAIPADERRNESDHFDGGSTSAEDLQTVYGSYLTNATEIMTNTMRCDGKVPNDLFRLE